MAEDTIVQKITITAEGGDAAAAEYKKVGDAADQAAAKITKAGAGGGQGFAQAGQAAEQAAGQIGKVGEAAAPIGAKLEEAGTAASGLGTKISSAFAAITAAVGGFASGFRAGVTEELAAAAIPAEAAAVSVGHIGEHAAVTKGEVREIGQILRELNLGPLSEIDRLLGKTSLEFGLFAGAAVAVAGITAALFEFARSASEVEQQLSHLQSVTGGSIENLSSLQIAFAEGGTAAKEFSDTFTKLADDVFGNSAKIKKDVEDSANAFINSKDAVVDAEQAVVNSLLSVAQAQQSLRKGQQDFANEAVNAAQTVAHAQLDLVKARAEQAAGDKGIDQATQAYLRQQERILAVKDAEERLAEARQKQADLARDQALKEIQYENALAEAKQKALEAPQKLAEAQQKAAEAQANDIQTLTNKYDNLSKGISQSFDPLTTLDSKVKAVHASLAETGTTIDQIGPDLSSTGEQGQQAFLKLADIFHNLNNDAQRAQLGKALGLSPDVIASLSKGSAALKQLQQDIISLGLALNSTDQSSLKKFKDSIDELSATWTALKEKMGALAAPAFTSFIDGMLEKIKEVSPALIKLASDFGALDLKAFGAGIIQALSKIIILIGQVAKAWADFQQPSNVSSLDITILSVTANGKTLIITLQDIIFYLKAMGTAAELAGLAIKQAFQGSEGAKQTQQQINETIAKWREYQAAAAEAGVAAAKGGPKIVDALKPVDGAVKELSAEAKNLAQQFIDLSEQKLGLQKLGLDTGSIDQQIADVEKKLQAETSKKHEIKVETKIEELDTSSLTKKLADLQSMKIQLQEAEFPTDDVDKSIADIKSKLKPIETDPVKIPPPDISAAESAWDKFLKLFDMSAGAAEFDQSVNKLVDDASKAGQEINDALKIKPDVDPSGALGFSDVVQAAEKAANEIEAVFRNIKPEFSGSLNFESLVTAAQQAASQVAQAFSNLQIPAPQMDFTSIATAAQTAVTNIQTAFQQIGQLGSIDLSGLSSGLSGAADAAGKLAGVTFDTMIGSIDKATTAFDSMASAADKAASAAKSAASASSDSGGGAAFARGGMVYGPGGGDVIHALLSAGEFVVNARAVSHYGADLFGALNSMRLPGSFRLPRFDLGGLVGGMVLPRFAAGGLVTASASSRASASGGRPLTLVIDGKAIGGMMASENAAKQLERAAISRQTTSTGTRPGWYR